MNAIFSGSVVFGLYLSLAAFFIGNLIRRHFHGNVLANPLIIGQILVVIVLKVCRIDYETYNEGAKYLSFFLTPATVCLAIPLYEQLGLLRHYVKAILAGIISGVLASACCILAFAVLFHFDHAAYVSFLPKSITTAIGIEMSQEMGGYVSLTVAAIILTGILGNMIAVPVCKICRITDPVAKGIAIGTASHAVGTAKALEISELTGAISGLSMVVAGLLTVAAMMLFQGLI